MYTPVAVQCPDAKNFDNEGHVYDISEGGVRFELDEPLVPGMPVSLRIVLPGGDASSRDQGVLVHASVVWVDDDQDEPGPVRMAASFTRFAHAADREKLMKQLSSGRFARAA